MPRPICPDCSDYIAENELCIDCPNPVHLACCPNGHAALCAQCGHARPRSTMHKGCGYCQRCCRCFESGCLECFSNSGLVQGVYCNTCHSCKKHCACEGLTLKKLRVLASNVRRDLDRLRTRSRNVANEDSLSSVGRQERAVFIPAASSISRDLVAPAQLSASALASIYEGGTIKGRKKGGVIITGLGNMFKENRSQRFLCPEIEVASGDQKTANSFLETWLGRCVHDGSLPPSGFEINVMPTQGDLFVRMVEQTCAMLDRTGATINKQCGLHVHVDARDFDYMDIRKLVFLYELVEPAIFACLPYDRHVSRFCQPCGFRFASHLRRGEALGAKDVAADGKNKYNMKVPVQTMVYGKSGRVERSGSKYGSGEARDVRYMGLNLYSWFYRGSVEFRHAPGSITADYITNWALICAGLLDTTMSLSERNICKMGGPYLQELVSEEKNLYKTAFKGYNSAVIEASTRLLKECCQERCHSLIDTAQEEHRSVLGSKKKVIVDSIIAELEEELEEEE